MKNLEITPVFPRPIAHVDNLCDMATQADMLDYVSKIFDQSGSIRSSGFYVDSTHQTSDQLHRAAPMRTLVDHINGYASVLLSAQGWDITGRSYRIKLGQMWANRSGPTDYLFPHVHAGSIISGAYYLSAMDPVSSITFYRDVGSTFPQFGGNLFSEGGIDYPCVPNRLILFRSDFVHGCTASPESTGSKIVLSFNLTYEEN